MIKPLLSKIAQGGAILILLLASLLVVSCSPEAAETEPEDQEETKESGESGETETSYIVTFQYEEIPSEESGFKLSGNSEMEGSVTVTSGSKVSVPEIDLTYNDNAIGFLGWYYAGTNVKFDFNTGITQDITLEARWKGYAVENDIWYVYSATGLSSWNDKAQKDPSLSCTLVADIKLSDSWTPVGSKEDPFTGTFDGSEYSITGMKVSSSSDYAGMFSYIDSEGTVKNLVLKEAEISGIEYVGAIAGYNGGTITACCNNQGAVEGTYYVGGIAGYNGGTITACSTMGTVKGKGYVGGIAGYKGELGDTNTTTATLESTFKVDEYEIEIDDGVWLLSSAEQLLYWNEAVQTDASLSARLTQDIDLSAKSYTWTPAGSSSRAYTGTFDGAECSIKGLKVSSSSNYAGMFGYVGPGGTVKDLGLEEAEISGNNFVGGIAGYNYSGTVSACTVSGSISGSSYVGGVAGENNNGTISACTVSGSISGSKDYVGGVAGENDSGTIIACSVSASVSGGSSGSSYVGGVVGENDSGTITASYSTGNVSGSSCVGGVVGSLLYGGNVTACYSTGNISGIYTSYVGGVAGENIGGTITACYWSTYSGNGIGTGTGNTTKVDDGTITWNNAVSGMNIAIITSGWEYEILTGNTLPTLKKT